MVGGGGVGVYFCFGAVKKYLPSIEFTGLFILSLFEKMVKSFGLSVIRKYLYYKSLILHTTARIY